MPASAHKFADFELDPSRFELRRRGRALKLERIPMELLLLLVEKQGAVATRQEIIDRLWGKEVFVDTEHGINTAIRKIRQVLDDDPNQPRFVQTVTGKGYRFVAPANRIQPTKSSAALLPQPYLADSAGKPLSGLSRGADSLPRRRDPRDRLSNRRITMPVMGITAATAFCSLVLAFALNLAGFRDRIVAAHQVGRIHSIAVLPLTNLSGDPSQDYFADGMTDELITALAHNHSLRVISRTSAMQYKGVNQPLREIAESLAVDGILEGSVSRSGDSVHVNLQLIYAPTDTHIWAQSYDRDLKTAMSLPDELSQTIAAAAKVAAAPAKPAPVVSPEAHDAYLQGRYFWFSGNDHRSQEYFEKAIQIQPDYAAAWTGVADSYVLRGIYGEAMAKDLSAPSEAAARKALELDDSLPAAHSSLAAWYLFYAWDVARAEAESRRAIELDSTIGVQHHLRSYILFAMNHDDEALQEQKLATDLGPFVHSWALGYAYLELRRFDDAIKELRLRADAMPNDANIRFNLSSAYWYKGMWNDSERELEKGLQLTGDSKGARDAHRAFEEGGEKAVREWSLQETLARARGGHPMAYAIAQQYAHLGDRANTLKFLEQSYRERYPWLVLLQSDPAFDFLHSDSRYQTLVREIGLLPTV